MVEQLKRIGQHAEDRPDNADSHGVERCAPNDGERERKTEQSVNAYPGKVGTRETIHVHAVSGTVMGVAVEKIDAVVPVRYRIKGEVARECNYKPKERLPAKEKRRDCSRDGVRCEYHMMMVIVSSWRDLGNDARQRVPCGLVSAAIPYLLV